MAPGASRLSLAAPGTLVLRGTLASSVTMSMTGAISVGEATDLTWDLPLVRTVNLAGYRQTVLSRTFTFDVQPDSFTDTTSSGHAIRRFLWSAPPKNTVIHLTERLQVDVTSTLRPFFSRAAFPLGAVPSTVTPYLATTPATTLSPAAQRFARQLVRGTGSETVAVTRLANWVASRTQYGLAAAQTPQAQWAFSHHLATCLGYSNLLTGMLRAAGVPAQVAFGWVGAAPVQVRADGASATIQWSKPGSSGDLHTWVNVYFPGTGWVPFDPQLEKFFVDPRHVQFFTNVDASDPGIGAWSATVMDRRTALGRPLTGGVQVVLPGDGRYSQVTLRSTDRLALRVQRSLPDVQGVRLFTR